ncbi:MAG: putative Ig domain-containing protein, partial [Methanomassiliicoccaceae archaeon]|nr:putative Ig domain-containing protein [Methanomassiliicoccaceae archaeon]
RAGYKFEGWFAAGADEPWDFNTEFIAGDGVVLTAQWTPIALLITTASLQDGIIGALYNRTLSAAGTGPVSWDKVSGDLPDGLSLNGTTGVISGTPTSLGTFNFTVKASNIMGSEDTKALSITITPVPAEGGGDGDNTLIIIIAAAVVGLIAVGAVAARFLIVAKPPSGRYAVISYSHANTDVVLSDLKSYEKNGVGYWYDGDMTVGRGFDTQFNEKLDDKNCKGIIFFVSDQFLLSDPCAKEMQYFKDKYGIDNPDKFCLFVLPDGFPFDNADKIYDKVEKHVHEKNDDETRKKLRYLSGHIDLYMELLRNGKEKFVTLGNADEYVKDCCGEGKLFQKAGIISKEEPIPELKPENGQ